MGAVEGRLGAVGAAEVVGGSGAGGDGAGVGLGFVSVIMADWLAGWLSE